MAFSFTSWLCAYAATKSANFIFGAAFSNDFPKKIEKAIVKWSKRLPDDQNVYPSSLFEIMVEDANAIARRHLADRIASGICPTELEWRDALMERWREVNGPDDVQPFYRLSEEEASAALTVLAKELQVIGETDQRLFQQTVIATLRNLEARMPSVGDALKTTTDSLDVTWRPCKELAFGYESFSELEHKLWSVLLCNAAYKAFGEEKKYFEFVSPVFVNDGVITIYTHQIRFAAAGRDELQIFRECLEKKQDYGALPNWRIDHSFPEEVGVYLYQFIYDSDGRTFSIKPKTIENSFTVDENMNTNQAWELLVYLTRCNQSLALFDFQSQHAAATKILLHTEINRAITFERMLINADSYDCWDYDFKFPKETYLESNH